MRIKEAMSILKKETKSGTRGSTIKEVVAALDKEAADFRSHTRPGVTIKLLQAYEEYKMNQGYYWKGTDHDTWAVITDPDHPNFREEHMEDLLADVLMAWESSNA